MPHTPLAKLLRHAASTAAQSDKRNTSTDHFTMSRRKFIRTISTASAGLALPSLFGTTRVATSARVVVVGAGWIGAEVAASARQRGLEVTVIEPASVPV